MAWNTITHQPQVAAQTNTQSGTTVADKKYVPTLTSTRSNGSAETFAEGEFNGWTTTHTYIIHNITDDLVTKYV